MQVWQPKQQLQNGKFTIQKVLGGGGYGVTYSAIDKNTNNLVAIKTLNPIHQSQADFDQQQVKFVQEAFRLVQCSHPHIVKVHEVINEDGLWGMVMEYVQGQDLAIYINQRGKLPEEKALKYINQVGTALEYIHKQGLLHRDVKPNNIMLRQSQEEAVLIDFGLAREFDLNQTGSMTNSKTEGYAPIEQYERRGKFGAYTDVYALAATFYALVTGDIPLPANFRQTGIPLPSPQQRNPKISDRVNDGIIKGMGLEPQDRPQTVREWLELVMPSQAKSSFVQNISELLATTFVSPKSSQLKASQVFQTPKQKSPVSEKIPQVSENNAFGNIQLQKFEFKYAKIDENLEITYYRRQTKGFIKDLGNCVTLEMVLIPGGSFIMGAPEDEEASSNRERPQHRVNIQPFFMGKYQVTQEQYQAIMKTNPSK
ncbi:MAG: bifunctional serine/threonine-protein kinase/formylglycine-generating enzyme family protein [Cyanobacteria bacterium J06639_18]